MKKNMSTITLLGGFAIMIAGALILGSCEGPEGPQGPQGPEGAQGPQGVAGADGEDANETCIVCHNSGVVILARQQQSLSSHHLTGGNYGRNHTDCAVCHTHQGFIETQATGELETASEISDPAPINCRTCHMIHNEFDESDWDFVTTTAVDLRLGGETVDLGDDNLCLNCHQSLALSPMPEAGGEDVAIKSSRYGPHHGPQGNNVWGVGGFEFAGSMSYEEPGSHAHAGLGCSSCHMAEVPYAGITAGGHTFNMTYVYHGDEEDNVGACTTCHPSAEDFDLDGAQTEIEELLEDLKLALADLGVFDSDTALWNVPRGDSLVVSADVAGAMINYKVVEEDRSLGIHNPPYIKALLTNTLEAMQ